MISWNEDTTTTLNLSQYFSDLDGDKLSYTVTSAANITLSINNSTSIVTLSADANFFGVRYVTFTASDGLSTVNSNNVTLNVNYLNDELPEISSFPIIILDEDSFNNTISLDNYVTDTDTDDSNITWTKIGGDDKLSFGVTAGRKANVSAAKDFNGDSSIILQASDGSSTDVRLVSIKVNAKNDAPTKPVLSTPTNNSIKN